MSPILPIHIPATHPPYERIEYWRSTGLGLVQVQPALVGSAPIASLLARIESHRTALAAHPQERNAQPILRRPGCATRHAYACLRRDAIPPATDPVLSESFLLTAMSLYLCAAV